MPAHDYLNLEIELVKLRGAGYEAELRLERPNLDLAQQLLARGPTSFDPNDHIQEFMALTDPSEYGKRLFEKLFAETEVRDAFKNERHQAAVQGRALRSTPPLPSKHHRTAAPALGEVERPDEWQTKWSKHSRMERKRAARLSDKLLPLYCEGWPVVPTLGN
ncbi:MAG TPA: hypothetical protein VJ183_11180 [Chloroflexia bacterium]|nr:hypothetical protein [Chloroflexia bacterium]